MTATAELGPATHTNTPTFDFVQAAGTVGERVARLRAWRGEKERDPAFRSEWMERLDEEIAALEARDPDEALWGLHEALTSPETTEEQRFVIRWQHRHHLYLDADEERLMDLLTHASSALLDRLALAFPVEVRGLLAWRTESDYAAEIRRLPIAFNL